MRLGEISESLVIRHESYCGRRFRADGFQAVWFIEEDQIKIYDRAGNVVRVTSATAALQPSAAEPPPLRRAA